MASVRTRIKSAALGIVLLSSLGGLAFAQTQNAPVAPEGKGYHQGGMRHHGHCGMMEKLGLTDAQKQQMKTLNESFRQENASLIADKKAKVQQLRSLGKGPENQAQRDALKAALKKDHMELRTRHEAVMKQVLTPDQMQRLASLKAECKAEWKAKHGKDISAPQAN